METNQTVSMVRNSPKQIIMEFLVIVDSNGYF